jgi:3-oxoacyl-[acyl-carrier-protein] synthase I
VIRIHAVGMASCLGPSIPACAALRASLFRPSASPDVEFAAPGEEEPGPITICALPVATFGFSGVGRLVALACELLKDVWGQVDLEALGPETGFFLGLTEPWEREWEVGEPDATEARRLEALGARVLEQSFQNLGLTWKGPRRFFGGGHVAFAQALSAAQGELRRRTLKACIVAGLDCLVEEKMLRALEEERRLKTPDNPVGVIPGEAGGALLLSLEPPRKGPEVVLHAVRMGREPNPRGSDRPADGRALARCVLEALDEAGARRERPLLVSDHNGEVARARELGMLLVHLKGQGPELDDLATWFPAVGFGEVGAAAGAVGACVAVRALQRGYAPSRKCLVLSCSDGAERAAVLLGLGGTGRSG